LIQAAILAIEPLMRFAALLLLLAMLSASSGCSAVSQWLAEMVSWRTGAGHSRQEMVDEYNSEAQSVYEMNGSY
jgi:hypothetical protein